MIVQLAGKSLEAIVKLTYSDHQYHNSADKDLYTLCPKLMLHRDTFVLNVVFGISLWSRAVKA